MTYDYGYGKRHPGKCQILPVTELGEARGRVRALRQEILFCLENCRKTPEQTARTREWVSNVLPNHRANQEAVRVLGAAPIRQAAE